MFEGPPRGAPAGAPPADVRALAPAGPRGKDQWARRAEGHAGVGLVVGAAGRLFGRRARIPSKGLLRGSGSPGPDGRIRRELGKQYPMADRLMKSATYRCHDAVRNRAPDGATLAARAG